VQLMTRPLSEPSEGLPPPLEDWGSSKRVTDHSAWLYAVAMTLTWLAIIGCIMAILVLA
jgi:hypothetical protein